MSIHACGFFCMHSIYVCICVHLGHRYIYAYDRWFYPKRLTLNFKVHILHSYKLLMKTTVGTSLCSAVKGALYLVVACLTLIKGMQPSNTHTQTRQRDLKTGSEMNEMTRKKRFVHFDE